MLGFASDTQGWVADGAQQTAGRVKCVANNLQPLNRTVIAAGPKERPAACL